MLGLVLAFVVGLFVAAAGFVLRSFSRAGFAGLSHAGICLLSLTCFFLRLLIVVRGPLGLAARGSRIGLLSLGTFLAGPLRLLAGLGLLATLLSSVPLGAPLLSRCPLFPLARFLAGIHGVLVDLVPRLCSRFVSRLFSGPFAGRFFARFVSSFVAGLLAPLLARFFAGFRLATLGLNALSGLQLTRAPFAGILIRVGIRVGILIAPLLCLLLAVFQNLLNGVSGMFRLARLAGGTSTFAGLASFPPFIAALLGARSPLARFCLAAGRGIRIPLLGALAAGSLILRAGAGLLHRLAAAPLLGVAPFAAVGFFRSPLLLALAAGFPLLLLALTAAGRFVVSLVPLLGLARFFLGLLAPFLFRLLHGVFFGAFPRHRLLALRFAGHRFLARHRFLAGFRHGLLAGHRFFTGILIGILLGLFARIVRGIFLGLLTRFFLGLLTGPLFRIRLLFNRRDDADDERGGARFVGFRRTGLRRSPIVCRGGEVSHLVAGNQLVLPGDKHELGNRLRGRGSILQKVFVQNRFPVRRPLQQQLAQQIVRINRPNFHRQRTVLRHFHNLLGRRQYLHLGSQVPHHFQSMHHRLLAAGSIGVSEANLIAAVPGRAPVGVEQQCERDMGLLPVKLHRHALQPFAVCWRFRTGKRRVEFQHGVFDGLVGGGVNGDLGSFERPDIPLHQGLRGLFRVEGKLILHLLHQNGRSIDHAQAIIARHRVAGDNVISNALLQARLGGIGQRLVISWRQFATKPQSPGCRLHRHFLVYRLAVGGGKQHLHRLPFAHALDQNGNGLRAATIDGGVTWLHIADLHARRAIDIGPGNNHASERSERILRGQNFVSRTDRQHGQQHIANPNDRSPVHGRLNRHAGNIFRGPPLQGFINDFLHAASITAEEQEVNQTVLQRRLALFNRAGGIGLVDAAEEERCNLRHAVIGDAADQQEESNRPPPNSQRQNPPVINQRHHQQETEHPNHQHRTASQQIHQPHMKLRPPQLLLNHRRGMTGRQRSLHSGGRRGGLDGSCSHRMECLSGLPRNVVNPCCAAR